MRDILLCATTFSLIITVLTFLVSGQQNLIEIDHKAFRLMECDPLIDMDGNEIKAPEGCVFGGYYPQSHPLDYEVIAVKQSDYL